jgi:tRNA 2-thiouridine synthesizing protein D
MFELAKEKGVKLDWVNCGLCVDERGVDKQIEGARRGSPVDAFKLAEAGQGFLYIGTR